MSADIIRFPTAKVYRLPPSHALPEPREQSASAPALPLWLLSAMASGQILLDGRPGIVFDAVIIRTRGVPEWMFMILIGGTVIPAPVHRLSQVGHS